MVIGGDLLAGEARSDVEDVRESIIKDVRESSQSLVGQIVYLPDLLHQMEYSQMEYSALLVPAYMVPENKRFLVIQIKLLTNLKNYFFQKYSGTNFV